MRFSAIFVLATAVVSGFAQTVAIVQADIASISSQVTAVDNAINSYPSSGGTLAGALAIHTAIVKLCTILDNATSDVTATPGPVSEADATTISSDFNAIVPTIQDAFVQIVVKKAAFDALPLGGVPALIKQDLERLCTSLLAFLDALIKVVPSDLEATVRAIRDQVAGYCATAQQGYP